MPCPHHDIKIVQRSNRQSAVAAAAYQSGERLFSEYDQKQKYLSLIHIYLRYLIITMDAYTKPSILYSFKRNKASVFLLTIGCGKTNFKSYLPARCV